MTRKLKYIDLADEILQGIKRDGLQSGDKLPSEKQLAATLGVNHLTVRRALQLLQGRELIYKVPSKGNFVGRLETSRARSGLIGVLFPEDEAFFYNIMACLENRMSMFGCSPVFHLTHGSPEREKSILDAFARYGVDGIIAAPNSACARFYRDINIPTVFFDTYIDGLDIPYVVSDDFKGACDAVEHLFSLGHRKIAYIGGKNDLTAALRLRGYKSVLNKYGIVVPDFYALEKEYSRQWGSNAAGMLLRSDNPPSAIFCGNDTIASGVFAYLSNQGMNCPRDVSLVGFGNLDFSDSLGLTTVDQACSEIAGAVWNNLRTAMDGEGSVLETLLSTSLIVRGSGAPV